MSDSTILRSGLGHVYYQCPECGQVFPPTGKHEHPNGVWIENSWLQEYVVRHKLDKDSTFAYWDSLMKKEPGDE